MANFSSNEAQPARQKRSTLWAVLSSASERRAKRDAAIVTIGGTGTGAAALYFVETVAHKAVDKELAAGLGVVALGFALGTYEYAKAAFTEAREQGLQDRLDIQKVSIDSPINGQTEKANV